MPFPAPKQVLSGFLQEQGQQPTPSCIPVTQALLGCQHRPFLRAWLCHNPREMVAAQARTMLTSQGRCPDMPHLAPFGSRAQLERCRLGERGGEGQREEGGGP